MDLRREMCFGEFVKVLLMKGNDQTSGQDFIKLEKDIVEQNGFR